MGCDAYSASPCVSLQGAQQPGTSAFLAILPQLDESPLYSNFRRRCPRGRLSRQSDASTSGWSTYVASTISGNVSIAQALLMRPPIFVCPSDIAAPNNTLLTPPTTTSSYALVLGELGANAIVDPTGNTLQPIADELQQKYYNNGPFVYLLPHRSADVRDGLSNTMFVGEATDGDRPGR